MLRHCFAFLRRRRRRSKVSIWTSFKSLIKTFIERWRRLRVLRDFANNTFHQQVSESSIFLWRSSVPLWQEGSKQLFYQGKKKIGIVINFDVELQSLLATDFSTHFKSKVARSFLKRCVYFLNTTKNFSGLWSEMGFSLSLSCLILYGVATY